MLQNQQNQFLALQSVETFYRRMYWQAPASTSLQMNGFALNYSGTTWLHGINQCWLIDLAALPDADLSTALGEARAFFRSFHAEYSVVLAEPLYADYTARLADFHCTERSRIPLMLLDQPIRAGFVNQELEIRTVTEETKAHFVGILREAFYLGPELTSCLVRPDQLTSATVRHYVGYLAGSPACCATCLYCDGGIASLWNIATLLRFRRQGLASALIVHALTEAAQAGYPISTLLASPSGRRLYDAMGYRQIGHHVYYSPPHVAPINQPSS